jgi:hypothetical protein
MTKDGEPLGGGSEVCFRGSETREKGGKLVLAYVNWTRPWPRLPPKLSKLRCQIGQDRGSTAVCCPRAYGSPPDRVLARCLAQRRTPAQDRGDSQAIVLTRDRPGRLRSRATLSLPARKLSGTRPVPKTGQERRVVRSQADRQTAAPGGAGVVRPDDEAAVPGDKTREEGQIRGFEVDAQHEHMFACDPDVS